MHCEFQLHQNQIIISNNNPPTEYLLTFIQISKTLLTDEYCLKEIVYAIPYQPQMKNQFNQQFIDTVKQLETQSN